MTDNNSAQSYRHKAQEARNMASTAHVSLRTEFLALADQWDDLAKHVENDAIRNFGFSD
jgi:hypothetical protein